MTTKDKQVWESYTRGVKPVRKKKKVSLVEGRTGKKAVGIAGNAVSSPAPLPFPPSGGGGLKTTASLERKREKSLRQGNVEIEAKLDLHGLTQVEAFAALADFMRKKVKAGKRRLLIVTGKGRDGEGVLRRNLENWLGQLPEAKSILAIRQAAPNHGGRGAFYVLLRKTDASAR